MLIAGTIVYFIMRNPKPAPGQSAATPAPVPSGTDPGKYGHLLLTSDGTFITGTHMPVADKSNTTIKGNMVYDANGDYLGTYTNYTPPNGTNGGIGGPV